MLNTWDGTSWTELADLNTARRFGAAWFNGITTNALLFGGGYGPPGKLLKQNFGMVQVGQN